MSCNFRPRPRFALVPPGEARCFHRGRWPALGRDVSPITGALKSRTCSVGFRTNVSDTSLSLPTYPRIELTELFQLAARADQIPWQPFREGVQIHRLYGDGRTGPTAALLHFQKAGRIPLHSHAGYEHILILAGSQRDQNSVATAGTLMINPPGTSHRVISEAGCIVLAIYEKPVVFLEE